MVDNDNADVVVVDDDDDDNDDNNADAEAEKTKEGDDVVRRRVPRRHVRIVVVVSKTPAEGGEDQEAT